MNNGKKHFIILSEKRCIHHISGKIVKIETVKIDKNFYNFCKNFKKDT